LPESTQPIKCRRGGKGQRQMVLAAINTAFAQDSFDSASAQIHTTNPLERLNGEIKRRTEVAGILPTCAAVTRLVGAPLLEQNDEWQLQRRDMQLEGLQCLSNNQAARLSAVVN